MATIDVRYTLLWDLHAGTHGSIRQPHRRQKIAAVIGPQIRQRKIQTGRGWQPRRSRTKTERKNFGFEDCMMLVAWLITVSRPLQR